ncbi:Uncharacterised protein at_DN0431, partial [Pycnogonum litorale]
MIRNNGDRVLLQNDLLMISRWFSKWNLMVNAKTCAVITLSRKRLPGNFSYSISGEPLNRVSEIKDLGVIMIADFTWSSHVSHIVNRASKLCGFVKRQTYSFKNISTVRKLYVSLVRPLLEYASVVWNPGYKIHDGRLECVQKRFTRYLCYKAKTDFNTGDYSDFCKTFNLPTLKSRRSSVDVIFLQKLLSGDYQVPNLLSDVNLRVPRSGSRSWLPRFRTECGKNLNPVARMVRTYQMNYENEIGIFGISSTRFRSAVHDIKYSCT